MISLLLAIWYMLPVHMFKLGYSVLDAGLTFTIVNLASIPLTYVVGKTFDRIPMRRGLVLIDILFLRLFRLLSDEVHTVDRC